MILEERLGALGLEHAECKAWRTTRLEYWRLAAEAGGSDAVISTLWLEKVEAGSMMEMTRFGGRAESLLTRDPHG